MIYVLLAILAALVAWLWVCMVDEVIKQDEAKHPLDGPTKQAEPEPNTQLNPDHAWPFPHNKH